MSYSKLTIKTNAALEIESVIKSYALVNISLSKRIEKEIRLGFKTISKNPESFQCRYSTIRVFWLNKFPYGVYYILEHNEVFILAFWHSKEDIPNKIMRNL